MRVWNLNGRTSGKCKCGSWLQHWLNYSHKPLPEHCAEVNCLQRPTAAAHVQLDWGAEALWYVVPLCPGHNSFTGRSLDLVPSAILVSADVKETCERQKPELVV